MKVSSPVRCMRAVDHTPWLLTGSIDGSVKLWDIKRGELLRDLNGFHSRVLCLDVCRSSRPPEEGGKEQEPAILAVGGSEDCTAKVCCCDQRKGRPISHRGLQVDMEP